MRIRAHLFFHGKPVTPDHCTGNFIQLERQSKNGSLRQNLKKFKQILRESSVEAFKIIIFIFKDFNNLNCTLY